MFRLFMATLLVAAVCWNADVRAQNATCTGSATGTLGNLTVPDGSSCNLSNATVNGNIKVGKNSILTVNGGITTITGNVQANQCQSVMLTGSVLINGNLEIQQCTADSGYVGPGIQIGGNFECHNNSGACVAQMGTVTGNIHIHNNSSQASSDLSLNTIGGELQCAQNTPLPTDAEGPNQIDGNVQGQCAPGFTLVTVVPTTQTVGPAGGTLTDSNGDQVVIPPGALAAATTVSLRPALLDEVQVALQSTIFAGQKLTFLGAVNIDTGGTTFAAPIQLAIPNDGNVATGTQIFLAKISPDVTGDGIPDLILVDTASVVGNLIQDGPGVTSDGLYGFFAITLQYVFVQGQVIGAGFANAAVWNSSAPDFVVLTDALGNFVAAVQSATALTVFTATSNNLTQAGTTVTQLPLSPTVRLGPKPQATAQALTALCTIVPPTLEERVLNKLNERIADIIKDLVTPSQVKLSVTPTTITIGGTATAVPDVASFLAEEAVQTLLKPFGTEISFPSLALNIKGLLGLTNTQIVTVKPILMSMPSGVVMITGNPPQLNANPSFTITGLTVGSAIISGKLTGIKFSITAQLKTTESDGTACIPITADISNDDISSIVADISPVPVTVITTAGGAGITCATQPDPGGGLDVTVTMVGISTLGPGDFINIGIGGPFGTINDTAFSGNPWTCFANTSAIATANGILLRGNPAVGQASCINQTGQVSSVIWKATLLAFPVTPPPLGPLTTGRSAIIIDTSHDVTGNSLVEIDLPPATCQ